MRKYQTIKKYLSLEEKKERLSFAKEWGEYVPNEEEFLKQEIYNEFVLMKCDICDYEETIELDFIEEIVEMHDMDYPELECPHCNKRKARMIPIDIYNEAKNKK